MKLSLRLKYALSYLIIVLAIVFITNTYGYELMYDAILSETETCMYNEAANITNSYLRNSYLIESSLSTLRKLFASTEHLSNTRIWITDPSGRIVIDSHIKNDVEGEDINSYDKYFLSNQTINKTTIHGLLNKESIAVIYPVTSNVDTIAYVVILSPLNDVEQKATRYTDAIIISLFIVSGIIFFILLLLYIQTVYPLKAMTKAAKEYASGHFDYPMVNINGHDQAELAAAIRYLADKMHDMNDYQKKFIANVSHDFRSPLTSIKGYATAMADGTIPPEMQGKYLDIILFETERLTKLTSNLLSLSDLENKGLPIKITTFDINHEIKRCSATFEQRCTEKHISLELTFDTKKLYVDADVDKIEQVIQNLLDNAIKFSNNNSVIEIHTAEKNNKIFVSVKDHGIGIPKESINKVWERFYKSDQSRGKDKKGTGLGLSISREIIEAHGENINVISTEGVGTEFIFTLPAHIDKSQS